MSDHAKYWYQYVQAGIPVFEPFKNDGHTLSFDNSKFVIRAFPLVHDVPCYGFYITHPEIGSLVYATDTEYIKYRFKGINHILVEANYSDDLVDTDAENYSHVLQGHMSLETALGFICTNDNPMLKNIVLLHLSDKNADSALFLQKTKEITDKNVYVAKKNLEVNLDLTPF